MAALGEQVDGDRIAFHPATRPDAPGGFDTIGARGCFLSHLAVLQAADRDSVETLLILEDDVAFSASEAAAAADAIAALSRSEWGIFYGGSPVARTAAPLTAVPADEPVLLAHFIAFTGPTIKLLVPYLEALLARPAGSPDGGPMHVDGAYSWFRRAHPEILAFAATPAIAHQRASPTDIHQRRGLDRIPLLSKLLIPARAIKNRIRARH